MFTRTLLDKSVLEEMIRDPSKGRAFIKDLEWKAVVLMDRDEFSDFKRNNPDTVLKILEKLLTDRRIRERSLQGRLDSPPMSPTPEIVVTESDVHNPAKILVTDMEGYEESEPIVKRRLIEEGALRLSSRLEFWKWTFQPVLDAFDPMGRSVDIVDQYVFQDFDRRSRRIGRVSGPASVDDIGLVWIMKRLNESAVSARQKLLVRICTAEKDGTDGIRQDSMVRTLEELLTSNPCTDLEVELITVPIHQLKDKRDFFLTRRFVINEQTSFTLGKGIRHFDKYKSETKDPETGRRTSSMVDEFGDNSDLDFWSWTKRLNPDYRPRYIDLLDSVPRDYRRRF